MAGSPRMSFRCSEVGSSAVILHKQAGKGETAMAAHAAVVSDTRCVSVEEYLNAEYRPDLELVDGYLREKPVVSPAHGRVQFLIGLWFGIHEADWSIQGMVEVRTRVTRNNFRLPDVAITAAGPLPHKALTEAPLIAIEVLSESDTYADLRDRAEDFQTMGVRNIWLIDPAKRTAEVWTDGNWRLTKALQAIDSPMYLDLAWLWKKLGPEAAG